MIKSSSGNFRKSSTECLVIGFCLYIAITFHNKYNLTEAKLANGLNNVSSVTQYPASQFTQLSCVLFPGLHVWSYLGVLQTLHVRFRFWSVTRSEILLPLMLKVSSKEF